MSTILIILICLVAIANGTLLTYLVIERISFFGRLCAGSVVGLAALSWIGYLTALMSSLNTTSIGTTVAISILGLLALVRFVSIRRLAADFKEIKLSRSGLIYYSAWTGLLVWLFSRVVMFYPDGLHTSPANNYGDLSFHLSIITSFAYGENLPPQNPIYSGMKFTYPFLIDFLTAFFMRCGADWRAAFFVENISLSLALLGLIELMALRLTGNHLAARITPVIFLFNGGLGFVNFFHDLSLKSSSLIEFITHLPQTYTMHSVLTLPFTKTHLSWGNVFTTLLIPQRSMLFGLPFVVIIVTLSWMAFEETGRRGDGETGRQKLSPRLPVALSPRRYLLAAGVLTGILPLLHAHGFFAVMIASVVMTLLYQNREWLAFYIPAIILALPQTLWLRGTQVRNTLFQFHPWWDASESNPLIFWAVNCGVFLSLLGVALILRKPIESRVKRFYIPFILWLIVPNVVRLAPWSWDNIKVLVYWSLLSCPLVAALLAYLFSHRTALRRAVAVSLLITLIFSGALDVIRALSPAENVTLYGRAELEVAELLREKTPPRSVILHAPIHNSVVSISGRQSVIGYPGHLWTHGIAFNQREEEAAAIYRGGSAAAELLSRLGVDYVIIGPPERSQLQPDENYFSNSYPAVIDHNEYRVFQVRRENTKQTK
jgi:hypothetical protein